MKIENMDNLMIVYLFSEKLDINNIDELNKKIKDVLIKVMKRYNIELLGYYRIYVYHNNIYGAIIEVEKIYDTSFNYRTIDLKITIYKNIPMYIELDDIYDIKDKTIILNNGRYYHSINSVEDINKYIEFGKIKYKKMLNEID